MNNEEIIKNSRDTIDKARHISILLKSAGWKIFQEIKDKKKADMVASVFKSEMTVKKHEYNRGAVNFIKDIEEELQGLVDDAMEAKKVIDTVDEE